MTATTEVSVRPLRLDDIPAADHIFRLAFGTYLGLPEPESFAGDPDFVGTRLRAGQKGIGAFRESELAGSNIVNDWGSVGFFGPLRVQPDLWDQGVAKQLMESTVAILDDRGARWGVCSRLPVA
jgi:predicted N-acetyltransferase YhbS